MLFSVFVSGFTNTNLPSAVSVIKIMPSLSMPFSALGARFTSTVTFLPIMASGLKLSAIPETIVLVSIPVSTFNFNNFFVLATFSASIIVPTRISSFEKSSKVMVSFWGSTTAFAISFAFLLASSLSSCACIASSSILENKSSALPIL